ncbi:MAG: hypothetical protein R2769_03845 [Saprospiraceae bacterium]
MKKLAETSGVDKADIYPMMELIVHGLAEFEIVSKEMLDSNYHSRIYWLDMFGDEDMDDLFN